MALKLLLLLQLLAYSYTTLALAAPNTTYTKLPGTDTGPGTALKWKECISAECVCGHGQGVEEICKVAHLKTVCAATPHCAGFNSNGWLKSCMASSCGQHHEKTRAVDSYVGSSVAPGLWPRPSPPPPPKPHPVPPPPPPPPPLPPLPPVSPPSPTVPVSDFHFPSEEAAEAGVAAGAGEALTLLALSAKSNSSGSVRFSANKSGKECALTKFGGRCGGWQLRSFLVHANHAPVAGT